MDNLTKTIKTINDDRDLRECIEMRNEITKEIQQLQINKREEECMITEYLVLHRMYDCFSVRWDRLKKMY